jgi:hypothetical protein
MTVLDSDKHENCPIAKFFSNLILPGHEHLGIKNK